MTPKLDLIRHQRDPKQPDPKGHRGGFGLLRVAAVTVLLGYCLATACIIDPVDKETEAPGTGQTTWTGTPTATGPGSPTGIGGTGGTGGEQAGGGAPAGGAGGGGLCSNCLQGVGGMRVKGGAGGTGGGTGGDDGGASVN